jgi:hypothetical protein
MNSVQKNEAKLEVSQDTSHMNGADLEKADARIITCKFRV